MAIGKQDILGAKDTAVRAIDIPEWGGPAFIRVLPGPDLDALSGAQHKLGGENSKTPARLAAEVVGRCLCDENGVRLFTDDEIGALAGKSARVLTRLAQACLEWNGLGDQAFEVTKGN